MDVIMKHINDIGNYITIVIEFIFGPIIYITFMKVSHSKLMKAKLSCLNDE